MSLNWFFLNGRVRGMISGKNYGAVGMALPVVCDLIELVSDYTKFRKVIRVNKTYSFSMGKVRSRNWKRERPRDELSVIGLEGCEFEETVVVLFFLCVLLEFKKRSSIFWIISWRAPESLKPYKFRMHLTMNSLKIISKNIPRAL